MCGCVYTFFFFHSFLEGCETSGWGTLKGIKKVYCVFFLNSVTWHLIQMWIGNTIAIYQFVDYL